MIQFTIKRFFTVLPVLLGVCTLTFLLIHFVPGDPVDTMLGEQAVESDKQNLRRELGLDQPLLSQYLSFMGGLAKGDLGSSLLSQKKVSQAIAERLPATAELTLAAMLLAVLISLPLGVLAAIKQYQWQDHAISTVSLFGLSMPGFFSGPLLIWLFAIIFPIFPVSDRGGIEHLFLPALSLALPLGAIIVRMSRASMLEEIHKDYVRVARSKGLNNFKIYFKHALRNSLIPVITIVGLQVGALLTGTVITETIFDWPGIGSLLLQAIQQRDYPLVQGCVLVIALTYVVVNWLTDVVYAVVDPKVRLSA